MKSIRIVLVGMSLFSCQPAFAEDKPTPPKLEVGKEYLVKTWNAETKTCSQWVPVKLVSVSEREDVGEFRVLSIKDAQNQWMALDIICDSQNLKQKKVEK